MGLTHDRVPALVVPDEHAWAMWGRDVRALGYEPAAAPADAQVLLAPRRLPVGLRAAVPDALIAQPEPEGAQDQPSMEEVMSMEGEPSADGLVMEPIDFELGPLAPGLPGGLVLGISLDGDVVARCTVRATLRACDGGDGLAPRASGIALRRRGDWRAVAEVEVERALSHLAWLRGLGRVLGWPRLVGEAHAALAPLVPLQRSGPAVEPIVVARDAVRRLERFAEGSRGLARRLRGRGTIAREEADAAGLCGPLARASGRSVDARADDPRYRALGFAPVVRESGDALDRTLLRVAETGAALELAQAVIARGDDEDATAPAAVEGPRGPLRVGDAGLEAAGAAAARQLAGERIVGLEWAAALAALVSFDLSPWVLG